MHSKLPDSLNQSRALPRTFVGAHPDLINHAEVRGEPVGQALGGVGVVLAAAGPVRVAVVHPFMRHERVLHALVGEEVGAGGADAAHDEVHSGLGGDDRAGEVGVGRVLPLAGPALSVLAGLGRGRGGLRRRRRTGHHDRAGEAGGLRAYPPTQALAEFVLGHCMRWEGGANQRRRRAQRMKGRKQRPDQQQGIGDRKRTESAPGAGDGADAGEVGGVVEELEDGGGGVGAEPVEEVTPAAVVLLRLHRAHRSNWKPMAQDRRSWLLLAVGRGREGKGLLDGFGQIRVPCAVCGRGEERGGEGRAVEGGRERRRRTDGRDANWGNRRNRVPGRPSLSFAWPLFACCAGRRLCVFWRFPGGRTRTRMGEGRGPRGLPRQRPRGFRAVRGAARRGAGGRGVANLRAVAAAATRLRRCRVCGRPVVSLSVAFTGCGHTSRVLLEP